MRALLVSRINSFVVSAVLGIVIIPWSALATDEPALTRDQIKEFLETAKVVNGKPSSKGVTHPWRLTLSDGKLIHDASFQAIDQHKSQQRLESGQLEFNFVD
ncbi:MAG: hypothetical protein JO159_01970, partial [Acidobacteria bacterium]|nr:hypothetical protein [Acidobacteriota bacterium]